MPVPQHASLVRANPAQEFRDIGAKSKLFTGKIRELLQMPLSTDQNIRRRDRFTCRRRHQMQTGGAHPYNG